MRRDSGNRHRVSSTGRDKTEDRLTDMRSQAVEKGRWLWRNTFERKRERETQWERPREGEYLTMCMCF